KCSISLAAHRIILLSVKSTTTYSALKGYCFSIPITQSGATHDHYPASADEGVESYLRRSHGDALVEERTNPGCSLTPAFSLGSVPCA
ncbi:hypothetical protein N301_15292, partial [Charadrius vociferus]